MNSEVMYVILSQLCMFYHKYSPVTTSVELKSCIPVSHFALLAMTVYISVSVISSGVATLVDVIVNQRQPRVVIAVLGLASKGEVSSTLLLGIGRSLAAIAGISPYFLVSKSVSVISSGVATLVDVLVINFQCCHSTTCVVITSL